MTKRKKTMSLSKALGLGRKRRIKEGFGDIAAAVGTAAVDASKSADMFSDNDPTDRFEELAEGVVDSANQGWDDALEGVANFVPGGKALDSMRKKALPRNKYARAAANFGGPLGGLAGAAYSAFEGGEPQPTGNQIQQAQQEPRLMQSLIQRYGEGAVQAMINNSGGGSPGASPGQVPAKMGPGTSPGQVPAKMGPGTSPVPNQPRGGLSQWRNSPRIGPKKTNLDKSPPAADAMAASQGITKQLDPLANTMSPPRSPPAGVPGQSPQRLKTNQDKRRKTRQE